MWLSAWGHANVWGKFYQVHELPVFPSTYNTVSIAKKFLSIKIRDYNNIFLTQ